MTDCEFSMLRMKNPWLWKNPSSMCYSNSLTPPTNYVLTLINPFSFVWYAAPLMKTGALLLAWPIACIGCNTCPVAASSGFHQSPGPPLWGNVHGIVPGHHRGHWNGRQSRSVFCCRFVCCCLGGRWGNTGWVVARWWHPVASRVALDMLHWAMPSVLLRRTAVATKMANDGSAFVHYHFSFAWHYS